MKRMVLPRPSLGFALGLSAILFLRVVLLIYPQSRYFYLTFEEKNFQPIHKMKSENMIGQRKRVIGLLWMSKNSSFNCLPFLVSWIECKKSY